MKYRWLALLSVAALTACEVGAAPSTPGNDDGDDVVINQTAGLNAYPDAGSSEVVPDGTDTRTIFETDASLQEVYVYFDAQLTAQGWQQTSIENDDDEIEADYTREGCELEFELERDDGRYELEIDIDGDNTDYDQDNGVGDEDDGDDGNGDDGNDDGLDG